MNNKHNDSLAAFIYAQMALRSLRDDSLILLDKGDLETLIDLALEIGDKDWFMELSLRYKAVAK